REVFIFPPTPQIRQKLSSFLTGVLTTLLPTLSFIRADANEREAVMKPLGQHAVVIGASMGGLLAARALADFYEQVTILERDTLPPVGEQRKGVPQGRHTHALLARGLETMQAFFPGLTRDLVNKGALYEDGREAIRWFHEGGYHCQFKSGLFGLLISRPLLEGQVRTRLLELPNLQIIGGC